MIHSPYILHNNHNVLVSGVSGHHDPAAVCPSPGGGAAPVRGPGHPLSRHVDCTRHEVHEDPQQDPQVDTRLDREEYLLYICDHC